ncbi:hypothetical protein GC163_13235 [bacterium]|nr:hypothetical protein [bacterium]
MSKPEYRSLAVMPTTTDQTIQGYAATYWDGTADTEFRQGRFVERLLPDSLELSPALYACLDHDDSRVLDHVKATLTTVLDARGLAYAFPLREQDPDHSTLKAKLDGGLITGSSVAFVITDEDWKRERTDQVRYVKRATVLHVSPVYIPAYPATSADLRSQQNLSALYQKYQTNLRVARLHKLAL